MNVYIALHFFMNFQYIVINVCLGTSESTFKALPKKETNWWLFKKVPTHRRGSSN